jgi:hypothetical protein
MKATAPIPGIGLSKDSLPLTFVVDMVAPKPIPRVAKPSQMSSSSSLLKPAASAASKELRPSIRVGLTGSSFIASVTSCSMRWLPAA